MEVAMAQGSRIAESFLDGIGCLGAIFEPAVRPGSQVNLIQSEPVAASEELSEIKERMSALEGIVARLRKENEELNSLLGKASSQVNQRA
jgi:hypothetical protein